MKKQSIKHLLFAFLLISFSCQSVNKEQEKQAIQNLMDQVAAAHFEKDADKFYGPNDETWWDVRGGLVEEAVKKDAIPGTQSYLSNMEFLDLSPTHEPIIELADDGSMASYIGAVEVKGRYAGQPVLWIVSWQSVMKKIAGEWKIIQTANTEMPEAQMAGFITEKAGEWLEKEKKAEDIFSIYALADCKGPGGNFTTLLFSNADNARFEQTSGNRHSIMGINKDKSWRFDPGSKELSENLDSLTRLFVQGHELHWLSLHPETRFNNPVFKGYKEYDGKTAFEIEYKDGLQRPVLFYYDFENYQPLGFVIYTGTLEAGETVGVYYKNWETQDGIQLFKAAEFRQGEFVFEYNFTKIELNQLSENDFSDPEKRI